MHVWVLSVTQITKNIMICKFTFVSYHVSYLKSLYYDFVCVVCSNNCIDAREEDGDLLFRALFSQQLTFVSFVSTISQSGSGAASRSRI